MTRSSSVGSRDPAKPYNTSAMMAAVRIILYPFAAGTGLVIKLRPSIRRGRSVLKARLYKINGIAPFEKLVIFNHLSKPSSSVVRLALEPIDQCLEKRRASFWAVGFAAFSSIIKFPHTLNFVGINGIYDFLQRSHRNAGVKISQTKNTLGSGLIGAADAFEVVFFSEDIIEPVFDFVIVKSDDGKTVTFLNPDMRINHIYPRSSSVVIPNIIRQAYAQDSEDQRGDCEAKISLPVKGSLPCSRIPGIKRDSSTKFFWLRMPAVWCINPLTFGNVELYKNFNRFALQVFTHKISIFGVVSGQKLIPFTLVKWGVPVLVFAKLHYLVSLSSVVSPAPKLCNIKPYLCGFFVQHFDNRPSRIYACKVGHVRLGAYYLVHLVNISLKSTHRLMKTDDKFSSRPKKMYFMGYRVDIGGVRFKAETDSGQLLHIFKLFGQCGYCQKVPLKGISQQERHLLYPLCFAVSFVASSKPKRQPARHYRHSNLDQPLHDLSPYAFYSLGLRVTARAAYQQNPSSQRFRGGSNSGSCHPLLTASKAAFDWGSSRLAALLTARSLNPLHDLVKQQRRLCHA